MRGLWAALLPFALVLPARAAEVSGYLHSRTQFTRVKATGLLPTDELPQLSELVEANAQVRQEYGPLGRLGSGLVYGDLSLIGQAAAGYRGLGADGEVALEPRDPAAARPRVSLNELYVSHEVRPALTLLLGKKRLVWGAGLALNPTDLLNPPKDPTDPSFQRAGAYVARVEVPLERFAFTFVASPAVIKQEAGIPYQLLHHPSWDPEDSEYHYQLALRGYALVADSDLNLMLFYGNRYADAFGRKLRAGASFSRYFFDDYELHAEALLQSGSSRDYVVADCVADALAALGCLSSRTPFMEKRLLEEPRLLPRVLVGGRTQFEDESLLSIEYLYQADGYTPGQLEDLVRGLELLREARRTGVPVRSVPGAGGVLGAGSEDGVPQRFAFEPLGRHYLFVTFQKPRIRDDFTLSATAITHLGDLSGLFTPSLAWSAREWLTLSLAMFVPFPGPDALATRVESTGEAVGEYTLLPLRFRALFELRAFY